MLFDNFYVNADVSADGHNWATAGIAPDYMQKLWPNGYASRRKHYDYEGERAGQFSAGRLHLVQRAGRGADGAKLRVLGGEQEDRPGPDGVQIDKRARSRRCSRSRTCATAASIWIIRTSSARATFLEDVKEFEASGNHAATDDPAAGERSHQRHDARASWRRSRCSPITITRWA